MTLPLTSLECNNTIDDQDCGCQGKTFQVKNETEVTVSYPSPIGVLRFFSNEKNYVCFITM